jgi:hypothetical protein
MKQRLKARHSLSIVISLPVVNQAVLPMIPSDSVAEVSTPQHMDFCCTELVGLPVHRTDDRDCAS